MSKEILKVTENKMSKRQIKTKSNQMAAKISLILAKS